MCAIWAIDLVDRRSCSETPSTHLRWQYFSQSPCYYMEIIAATWNLGAQVNSHHNFSVTGENSETVPKRAPTLGPADESACISSKRMNKVSSVIYNALYEHLCERGRRVSSLLPANETAKVAKNRFRGTTGGTAGSIDYLTFYYAIVHWCTPHIKIWCASYLGNTETHT